MQRRMQNSHVIITQLRKLVVPPLGLSGAQTYFSFPSPAHFRTRMRIRGKIRLARLARLVIGNIIPLFVHIQVPPEAAHFSWEK